ncbi:MAG: hypothetical protein CMJ50_10295 [Planctomycetaceae bacterium]|nr:hypothetical protein [Planctomycetaceae bacterium]
MTNMDWLSTILNAATDSDSEETLNQIRSESARIRELLQHAMVAIPSADANDLRAFPDLAETLKVALEAVEGDFHRVWYRPSLGFESSIDHVDSVVMGGLHSPAFLWSDPVLHPAPPANWPALPLIWQATSARILTAESMGDVAEWIPFLEQVAKANQPLVCVTSQIARELLEMFIVNNLMGHLQVAVIQPPGGGYSNMQLNSGETPDARLGKSLPIASVFARRAASILMVEEDSMLESPRTSCVWINVGGSDYQDQQHRLKTLARVIAQQTDRPPDTDALDRT